MARTNNLTNFLTDVASAIKAKLGTETPIPASQFDTKIGEIETGGTYQAKSITIQSNGSQTVTPDSGYDALSSVAITVQVPVKQLQSKTYEFTQNTHIVLSPETGYDGFSSIDLTINVPGSTINNQDKTITQNGTYTADSGYTGLGEVTVNVPSLDTSDATATASDILEPKTAYANGKKLYGTLKTEYQDSDINLYYMMINSTYNETIIYSRTLKLYDIVFIASISSTKLYLHAIKNNKIEALQEFDLSENGFYSNSSMVGISYDATHTTADNIDLVIFTERNTTSGNYFSFYQRWVKFLYDTGERTFTKNSTYYNRSDTRYGNTDDRYHVDGFADIEPDVLFPNYFHLMDNMEDYGPHCYWNIINLQWDDEGTPRATTLKSFDNFANISAYDNMYITGDGNYLTYRQGVFKLNGQRTNTDGGITNQSTPVFISHNLKYIVNNRYLYKCNGDLNISTNWSSRIQIGAQLPSYNVIYFSENDNYMILTSNNYIYVYRINAELNDYILVQQFNSNSTFQTKNIVWNSDYMHNFDNSNLTETFYDCSGEKILKRIIKEDIVYEYVLPEEVPSSTNNVLIGNKYFDGNRVLEGSMPNNGALSYTPSTSQQSIPAGYTSGGTVGAVTSAIDSNIQAGNIKRGVTILGVEGTYDGPGYDPNLVLDTLDAGGFEQYLGGTPITDITNVCRFDVFNANGDSILYYVMKTVTARSNMTGFSMNNIRVLDNGVIQWIPYGNNTIFNTDDFLECTITCTDAYNNTETKIITIYNSEKENYPGPDDPSPDDPGPDDPGLDDTRIVSKDDDGFD